MVITSASNPIFSSLKSYLTSKGIQTEKTFLVAGKKLLEEKIKQNLISQVVFDTSTLDKHSDLRAIHFPRKPIVLSHELFVELDVSGTHFPLGICHYSPFATWDNKAIDSSASVLLAMQDPNNVGAAIRNCAAFGVNSIVLLKECAHPFHPRAMRASSGTSLQMTFFTGPSIQSLEVSHESKLHRPIIGLDMEGTPLPEFQWPKSFYLLVGEEGKGVPKHFEGQCVSIPMNFQAAESLNAATALALALYDYQTKSKL